MAAGLRKWLSRLLWVLLGLPLALLAGEGSTRILYPQNVDTILDILVPDSIMGFIYEPGARRSEIGREYNVPFNINSLGLRDREYEPKADDAFRVLLVGDSFCVSHAESIQHSLSRQLESSLQAEMDRSGISKHVEVINAANAGYSPYQYSRVFRRWGPVFHPDAVFVGLFMGDDYNPEDDDDLFFFQDGLVVARYKKGNTPQARKTSTLYKFRKFLARNSEFYILFRNFAYYGEFGDRIINRGKVGNKWTPTHIRPFLTPEREFISEGWQRAYRYIDRLHRETTAEGIPTYLVPIPLRLQVMDQYFEKTLADLSIDSSDVDRDQPLSRAKNFARDAEIPLFDPLPALRAAEEGEESCYFVYDNHWNQHGIGVASRSIAELWRKRGYPPFQGMKEPDAEASQNRDRR